MGDGSRPLTDWCSGMVTGNPWLFRWVLMALFEGRDEPERLREVGKTEMEAERELWLREGLLA